jgi:hypothetical protein
MRVKSSKFGQSCKSQEAQPAGDGYKPEYARIALVICQMGGTDGILARAINVDKAVIVTWRKNHEDFRVAHKTGGDDFDNKVVRSLATRACGYNYKAVKIMKYRDYFVTATYMVHVKASVMAAIFWLVNRQSDEWRYRPAWIKEAKPDADLADIGRELGFNTIRPKEK